MTLHPVARLEAITPSLTLSLDDRVRTLIAEGQPIVNLTVGQPDFDTPKHVCEAAARAIAEGFTRHVCADKELKPRRFPDEVLAAVQSYVEGASER